MLSFVPARRSKYGTAAAVVLSAMLTLLRVADGHGDDSDPGLMDFAELLTSATLATRIHETYVPVVKFWTSVSIETPNTCPLPEDWVEGQYHCNTTRLARSKRTYWIRLAQDVLRHYPDSLLRPLVDRVYIVSDLVGMGDHRCGAYWDKSVIVAAEVVDSANREMEMRRTIHHEISSIYLQAHREVFPTERWNACNPPGFAYLDQEMIPETGYDGGLSESAAAQGFATDYGKMDMENDFNEIVSYMLEPDERFIDWVFRYKRLRMKAALALSFVSAVNLDMRRMVDPRIVALCGQE